jgi:hypothetical protein
LKLKNIYGREVNVNPAKYRVDWDRVVSKPQKKIKDILRPFWGSKQVSEEFYIPSSKMRIDLINFSDKIVVEVSPNSTHSQYNEFFNKNRSNFLAARKRDIKKTEWCLENGFEYIEIMEEDLKLSDRDILNLII